MSKTINIAEDFSMYPSGRIIEDGPYSGQKFREEHLVPALKDGHETITIILDEVRGYPSSFSDEAFGGLVREEKFDKDDLLNRLNITFSEPYYEPYKNDIIKYIKEA